MLEDCREKAMFLKVSGLATASADQICSRPRNVVAVALAGFVATKLRGGRGVDRDAFDSQLFHATSESVGMESKNLGGATRTFNDPFCLPENVHDVSFFNFFQGRVSRRVASVVAVGADGSHSLISGCGIAC